jgi:hypothetical protein
MQSSSNAAVACDEVDRGQLLQDILASRHFKKSPRLRDFLSYICARASTHRFDEISEQQIAVHVFGRSSDYNAAEDTIVRTAARQLRQKLELYRLGEGADSDWRLTIPKGSYVPLFERNGVIVEAALPATDEARPPPVVMRRLAKALGATMACGILIWGGVSVAEMMDPRAIFWRTILTSDQATQLVSGDSGLPILQGETHHAVHIREYAGEKLAPQPSGAPALANGDPIANFWRWRYTSVADLIMAVKTATMAEKMARKLDVRYARDISLRDLKAGNVILVGGPGGNPWVELFSQQLNFDFQIASASGPFIVNREPIGQEDATYQIYPGNPTNKAYAIIALTGGLDGHSRVLLLEGTSVAGTDAAVDFLFNSQDFTEVLKSAIHGRSIDDFEVLLETENVVASGTRMKVIGSRVRHLPCQVSSGSAAASR